MEIKKRVDGRKHIKTYFDPATNTAHSDRKAKARYRIEKEILPDKDYDIFDIIADLSKRLNMIEKGVMLLLKDLINQDALPTALEPYRKMINSFCEEINNNNYITRTDLKANNFETFLELLRRDKAVAKILIEEGYDER